MIDNSRSRFVFKHDWFELIEHEWEQFTVAHRDKKLRILEIGSFEGASTTWVLDHLMSHPESRMTAIDTWEGGMDHINGPTEDYDSFNEIEARFESNVAKCSEAHKLRVIKARSEDALMTLRKEGAIFDFIYIVSSFVIFEKDLISLVLIWSFLCSLTFTTLNGLGCLSRCN